MFAVKRNFGARHSGAPASARHTLRLRPRRLRTEPLEDRRMLAVVTVDNNLDVVNGDTSSIANLVASDGGDGIALREALEAANNTLGADDVLFDGGLSGQTILLGSTELSITDAVTIRRHGTGHERHNRCPAKLAGAEH